MKKASQLLFFIVLFSYIGILFSGSYVSVYYTYVAIPLLPTLWVLGFLNLNSIGKGTAMVIFFLTLLLYIITLVTVSYVGVYLSVIAIPILLVSGFISFSRG